MLTLVKRTAFIGLGFAAMNYATIKKLGNKIAEESNLSEEEGRKLVTDLVEESKRSRDELKNTISKTVRESISELDLATSQDIQHVEERLDNIEGKTNKSTKTNKRFVEAPKEEKPVKK